MVKRSVVGVVVWLATAGLASGATAASMYTAARAQEQTVRALLADPSSDSGTRAGVREVVSQYEALVREYPASGYSDNALWQAGRLLLDAYDRFGDERDWRNGVRFLRRLAATYPTSKLAKLVPDHLKAVGASVVTSVAVGGPALLQPASASATIKSVHRLVLPDVVRVTIEVDAEVPFHEERLSDPSRVFVDLPSTRAAPDLMNRTLRFDADADIIRQVRLGRHPNNTTRVVLDADGMSSYSVYALYNPFRLVVDCVRGAVPPMPAGRAAANPPVGDGARSASPTQVLRSRRVAVSWGHRLPAVRPLARELLTAARADLTAQPATSTHGRVDAGPARTETSSSGPTASVGAVATPLGSLTGGFSIARQLGLSVSRIVIDPGHGGHDPGAKGKNITEAELVLDVALRLEALLQKLPGVEVILTRRTDEFVPLPDRTAIANREAADLFLSIHANASASAQAHGIETYFLNFAKNQSAAAVAARENAESAQAMGALPDFVKAIALNNKLDESRDFAAQVQRTMVERLRGANKGLRDLGVKQAPFVVLIGAAMPSVLAEISFLTNPQEARLLRGTAYRQRIAEALLAAIRKYQTSLKSVNAVAHQIP